MKVLDVVEVHDWIVETDRSEFPEFRRLDADNWEQRMGESWEPVWGEESELEAAFQEHLNKKGKK